MPLIVAAVSLHVTDPAVRRLLDAAGTAPPTIRERLIGEPSVHSRRLRYPTGVEVILNDEIVAAVTLHVASTDAAVELSAWIPGIDRDATLKDLVTAIGAPRSFAGFGQPFLTLDAAYVCADFADDRGWNEPGNLVGVTVVATKPGLSCRPDDDDCTACAELLVRDEGAVDVDATVGALAKAVSAGALVEDLHWVRLSDLLPLHASRLMPRVECQLRCTRCRRILCFALVRDGGPRFEYCAMDEARRHPLEAIPAVELWGDEARIAADQDALHYVDHEPGAWFLVRRRDELFLDARYIVSSMVDDSALVRLDASEIEAYRADGRSYVSGLARSIHDGSPHREDSPFYGRNLFRGSEGKQWRDAVAAAIVNHTWLAQQRR
ncbi:hypothetical protein ACWGJP_14810 [Microbacterium sp. NPDC055903]